MLNFTKEQLHSLAKSEDATISGLANCALDFWGLLLAQMKTDDAIQEALIKHDVTLSAEKAQEVTDLAPCPFCGSNPFIDLSGSTRFCWCPNDQCGIRQKSMLDSTWQRRAKS